MALRGEIKVPGDKSISHRAVMIGSLADGDTHIKGFLAGADCLSTIDAFSSMGIDIVRNESDIIVHGKGMHGLSKPFSVIDCGNSGTTTRLISGILSAQDFVTILTGDDSIGNRPMDRIIIPLRMMGADISSDDNSHVPLTISPASLHGISYNSPVASAQVKSCILLAGLYADGVTSIKEPYISRNHTEIMLKNFGADIKVSDNTTFISHTDHLYATDIDIPGDISSAAYFMAAALIVPDSEIILKHVGINPTRSGIIKVIKMMGGNIEIIKVYNEHDDSSELAADIKVSYSKLSGCHIGGDMIPTLIDEIPIICALAACSEGTTTITDAYELRVKESDRISVMSEGLANIGIDIIKLCL